LTIFHSSVRAKIRDEVDGYSASTDYWIRCLYEGERGDPEDVEKGFLKSELLVRVHTSLYHNSLGSSILTASLSDLQSYIHVTVFSRG